MPRHQNKHGRGSKRSSMPAADHNPFEALNNLPQGEASNVQSSPSVSKSSSPKRVERTPSIPTASSVYSRTTSAASDSVFSKEARKASSASSNHSLTSSRAHSLASLPASNKSDASLTSNAVDDFAQIPLMDVIQMGLPIKHIKQIQDRQFQIADKARAKAEAKAQRKNPAPQAAPHGSLPRRPSSHRSSRSSTPMRNIPSGLSSRTFSSSQASFGTSYDSYGNERRHSAAESGTSCEDGSVISGGSGHAEIDPWGETITEQFSATKTFLNPALTQGVTKTGYVKWNAGKSKTFKPQLVSRNSGVYLRGLPSDDGASSSSSEEIIATPYATTHRIRARATKALPKHFNYVPGDRALNRSTNEALKEEYGARRGGKTSASFGHVRHTTEGDLESLGSRLLD